MLWLEESAERMNDGSYAGTRRIGFYEATCGTRARLQVMPWHLALGKLRSLSQKKRIILCRVFEVSQAQVVPKHACFRRGLCMGEDGRFMQVFFEEVIWETILLNTSKQHMRCERHLVVWLTEARDTHHI